MYYRLSKKIKFEAKQKYSIENEIISILRVSVCVCVCVLKYETDPCIPFHKSPYA